MHHMCHQVDYALQLFNEPVKRVYAQAIKSAPDCPSEESISVILTFESGAIAELSDGLSLMSDHFFSVIGSKAAAYQTQGQLQFCDQLEGNDYGQGGSAIVYRPESWGDDSLMAFHAAVTGTDANRNYPLTTTPVNSYMAELLKIELAICESVKTHTPITIQ